MEQIVRVKKFFTFYIVNNPRFAMSYVRHYFDKDFSFDVEFYSVAEYRQQLALGRSLIRIGDGEVFTMNGGGIGYQGYEKDIAACLWKCVREYSDVSPYVLGVNEHVMNKSNEYLKEHGQFRCWLPMKVFYNEFFNKSARYVDASIFYYPNMFEECLYEHLKNKTVVIVTKESTCIELQANSKFDFKDVSYVVTPDKDTYKSKESIMKEIASVVTGKGERECVILFGCGPAGKVFAFEWLSKGVQSIDVGVGMELAMNNKPMPYILLPKT